MQLSAFKFLNLHPTPHFWEGEGWQNHTLFSGLSSGIIFPKILHLFLLPLLLQLNWMSLTCAPTV